MYSLKKIGVIAFATGFAVPIALGVLGRCLDAFHVHPGMWLSTVSLWLWPTCIALIETSNNWQAWVLFLVTAIGNGFLYALVALVIGYCVRVVVNREWRD